MKSRIPLPRGPPPAKTCVANSSGLKGELSMAASRSRRYRRRWNGLEMRQCFDAPQPGEHRLVLAERNAAFRRVRDIRIASQVGDGCVVRGKKTTGGQMMVHEREERCGDLFRARKIAVLQHGDLAQRIQLVKFR